MVAAPRIRVLARDAEESAVNLLVGFAPFLALSPAAWITGARLVEFLRIPLWAAVPMACGVELMGLAIVATRTGLIGRNLPHLERRMDLAFCGYLAVVISVNGVLAAVNMGGLTGWLLAQAIGRAVAEMVLALMALPSAQLMGVRRELHLIDGQAAQVKAEQAQAHADGVAERERAQDRENARVIELRKLEIAEAAAKRAERREAKTTAPKKAPQPAATYRNKHEMAAALIPAFIAANGRIPTLSEVSAMLSVKASMASTYREPYK